MDTTFFGTFGNCRGKSRETTRKKQGESRPHFQFHFTNDWTFARQTSPELRLAPDVRGVAFDIDLNALAKQAGRPLARLEADFLWLALAVYLADRSAPRYPYGTRGPAHWRRRIHLRIPVSDAELWQNAEADLVHVLEFLTEDDWTFEFLSGRAEFDFERQQRISATEGPNAEWSSLFSGGLDSLAGTLQWLTRTNGAGLLVSGQTHSRIAAGQCFQASQLRDEFPGRVEHVGVGYGFVDKKRNGIQGFESTQRTRAFIHVALGSVSALMADNSQLFLFENGFGALNLPCDSSQFGSRNSRGTHPVFLLRMSALVAAIFSRPFVIANPFTLSTKGQMISPGYLSRFTGLLQSSFSCDRYPNYKHPEPQCGHCPSCLIRRLSFHVAGIPDDVNGYSTDVFSPRRPLGESELIGVSKLTVQADLLESALLAPQPWPALCANWPDLLRTEIEMGTQTFRASIISLLQRHVKEWRSFSSSMQIGGLPSAA